MEGGRRMRGTKSKGRKEGRLRVRSAESMAFTAMDGDCGNSSKL